MVSFHPSPKIVVSKDSYYAIKQLGLLPFEFAGLEWGHSIQLWLGTPKYLVQIPAGLDVCHRSCAHTVLQTVQRNYM